MRVALPPYRTLARNIRARTLASPPPSRSQRYYTVQKRQWSTPLAQTLAKAIEVTGPITVAAYMRQCLTSPDGGYYTDRAESGTDQFGRKGDFITSPEISQIFGELVGIWFFAEWMAQGRKPSGVHIMEIGPGRGTLMADMLRTIENFKPMASSIECVYLVEASPMLRELQCKLLCGGNALKENDMGYESRSTYLNGVKIVWTEDIRLIPKEPEQSPFIVAHEFFDALPIHIFQNVERAVGDTKVQGSTSGARSELLPSTQWREMVVTPAPDPDPMVPELAKQLTEFELSVSRSATPHSMYLPESSSRYKEMKDIKDAIIEISPESLAYASDLAVRIGGSTGQTASPSSLKTPTGSTAKAAPFSKPSPSGAALILDYGTTDTIPANSLRGIRQHERVPPLSSPGAVDVSADVDFFALAHAALEASPNVVVHGPMEQGSWLRAMGIQERAEMLIKNAKTEERKRDIQSSWHRLVDRGPQGMGKLYKAMAIVPYTEGQQPVRRPVGFGGDVAA